MVVVRPLKYSLVVASTLLGGAGQAARAQADMAPVNDRPNPYKTVTGWYKLPPGRVMGSTSAVAPDKDGVSMWVAERCGTNACLNSNLDPVLKLDANGNVVAHFGAGMIISPHGLFIDRDGNVWVVDCTCTVGGGRGRGGAAAQPRPDSGKGHQVYKFSPDGKLLMTLGTAGGARAPGYFTQPNAVLVAPNGDVFISEGHSSAPGSTARILKFSKDGKLVTTFGDTVSADGFNQPHALAMDSRGRLFVADRANNRIKILDQNGKLLDTWYQFGRPSGVFIDKNDIIYVADSESGSVSRPHAAWKRGIRIGSAKDGSVTGFIPDPMETCPQGQPSSAASPCATNTSSAEGVAVDSQGNIYGAEVDSGYPEGTEHLKKYIRR